MCFVATACLKLARAWHRQDDICHARAFGEVPGLCPSSLAARDHVLSCLQDALPDCRSLRFRATCLAALLIGPQGPSARLFEGPARPMSSIGQSCGADPRLLGRESLDVRHLQPKSQRQERTTGT